MTDLASAIHAELAFADQVLADLREALPRDARARDPLVIAAVGDLQVRLAAAPAPRQPGPSVRDRRRLLGEHHLTITD